MAARRVEVLSSHLPGRQQAAAASGEWKLRPHPVIKRSKAPTVVCILDGWGENKVKDAYNAVHAARTPNFDRIWGRADRRRTVLAHGPAVGLPSSDDMGNSEVGHNALGSGQVVAQGAKLVDIALENGSIFTGAGWKHVSSNLQQGTLHLIGLLSTGGVHSRYNQLQKLMQGAAQNGAKRMRVHILTDGRDEPDGQSVANVAQLEADIAALKAQGIDAAIASGGGRMGVTMDRYEADWRIVERGWKAHVLGEAPHKFSSAGDALKSFREKGGQESSDQWMPPWVVVGSDGKPVGPVVDGDSVVIFNFRADRVIELSKAFEYKDFKEFDRVRYPDVKFAGMMQYDGDLQLPANFLVDAPNISRVSGEYLVRNSVRTFAVSETQKFGHVTFFWNGNRSGYIDEKWETYHCEESDKVPFDQKPLMKAREVTDVAKAAIRSGRFDMIRVNYANPDMVGHTGNLAATVRAVEFCDECLGELLAATEAAGGRWLVTADHGNADDMVQRSKKTKKPLVNKETGELEQLKSHTLAPVPVCIGGDLPASVGFRPDAAFPRPPGLANITATYLNLLGFAAPDHYEPSLLN
eukprot:TRINITY_DN5_c0_g2_i1.p1 TRINITY_DN5_c0_g2~~TRINITY_DN5_c0_g2_i1.p1  ORF type:complete len:600 (+),score=233.39 TRINITY_DN5_c0_g2_i1:62-1801(+)